MPHPSTRAVVFFLCATALSAAAQGTSHFRARLSTVPIDVAMQNVVAGSGVVRATLSGSTLTVTGEFSGLRSPATVARIHLAPRGIRGPGILDLEIASGTSGTIRGQFELDARHLEALKHSRLYVQVHSEKAPEGNLWGWILPQEPKR
jgi:hypothetical protein